MKNKPRYIIHTIVRHVRMEGGKKLSHEVNLRDYRAFFGYFRQAEKEMCVFTVVVITFIYFFLCVSFFNNSIIVMGKAKLQRIIPKKRRPSAPRELLKPIPRTIFETWILTEALQGRKRKGGRGVKKIASLQSVSQHQRRSCIDFCLF